MSRRLEYSPGSGPHNYILTPICYLKTKALIDSGAARSCISEKFLQRLPVKFSHILNKPPAMLTSASGNDLKVLGTANLRVDIAGLHLFYDFVVIRDLSEACIIGIDFMEACQATIDIHNKTLSLFDGLAVTQLISKQDENRILRLAQPVKIPPRTEVIAPVYFGYKYQPQLSMTEEWPDLRNRLIATASCLVQPRDRRTVVRLLNLSNTPKYLRTGAAVGLITPVDPLDEHNARILHIAEKPKCMTHGQREAQQIFTMTSSDNNTNSNDAQQLSTQQKRDILQQRGINFDDCMLTTTDFATLIDLLYTWKHLFITDELELPPAVLPPVEIKLQDETPIRLRQFRC